MKNEFMKKAIELSVESVNNGGGPFGCVIVKDKKIISEEKPKKDRPLDEFEKFKVEMQKRIQERI